MLGDVLLREISKLKETVKGHGVGSFWLTLRDIACKEIIEHGKAIDSDIIIPIYYQIMCENSESIPLYFREKLPSNNQERFRVINRNLFSSNAFHPKGIAKQKGIKAIKTFNRNRKGEKIIFEKET